MTATLEAPIFTDRERKALRRGVRLRPSAWAESFRLLSRVESSRPGPWRNANAPYLRGIMDLCQRPGVTELVIIKCAQAGVSEAIRNVIGSFAHQEPDPCLLVLPDEQTGRKVVKHNIVPLFENTPVLADLLTEAQGDVQLRQITLANGFTLRLGWAGSPASLATFPARIVILDECDKYVDWSGKDGSPIDLARVRTQTYEDRRLIVALSSPTTSDGYIATLFESADVKLYFHVPCPHCGRFQRLIFSQLKWDAGDAVTARQQAAHVERHRAAWYECGACAGRIGEFEKTAAVRAGVWATEAAGKREDFGELAAEAGPGGVVDTDWPAGSKAGVAVSTLMTLWVRFDQIAAEFLRSKDDVAKLFTFMTSWLGEPFQTRVTKIESSVFSRKCETATPPSTVPVWAGVLIATVDVQLDYFVYVVRAWGPAYRSQRVTHGIAKTFDDLQSFLLDGAFPVEGTDRVARVARLGIDTGYRTHEVYRFVLTNAARIVPLRGENKPTPVPIRVTRASYRPPGQPGLVGGEVMVHRLDTGHYKDRLNSLLGGMVPVVDANGEVTGEAEAWTLNSLNDPDYNRQMASEHKVVVKDGHRMPVQEWRLISSGAANHYLDCEAYQVAMADICRVDLMAPQRPPPRYTPPQRQDDRTRRPLSNRGPIRRTY